MTIGNRVTPWKDPYRSYNFKLEIDGSIQAQFQECSGLNTESDVVEYREGNQNFTVRKLPGLVKYSNITLKKGITVDNQALWDWRKAAADGKVKRFEIAIVLMDEAGDAKCRWELTQAWPSKWEGSSFNATSSEVAVETIEIVHEGFLKAEYK